jgi:hypothetical protein
MEVWYLKIETLLIVKFRGMGVTGDFKDGQFLTLLSYGLSKKVKKQTTGKWS